MSMRCFIYGLIDPRDGQLRYVGKSTSGMKRPRSHVSPTHLSKEHTHKANWLRQLLSLGLKPDIEVLETCSSPEELSEAERFFIAYFRMVGANLTNLTDGGGSSGRRLSAEVCERIARKLRGLPQSEETKKKRAEANRGQKRSLALRQRMSFLAKARVSRDLQATKSHMAMMRQHRTAESYLKQAASLSAWHKHKNAPGATQDPEVDPGGPVAPAGAQAAKDGSGSPLPKSQHDPVSDVKE